MTVDLLAVRVGVQWQCKEEIHSQVAELELAGSPILLVKPQTYVNRSGLAVLALSRQRQLAPGDLLIVLDDFLLDFGRLRFRRGGSDGGHHGLASILEEMGTRQIPRLRLGIGQPPPEVDAIDYVLSPFAPGEAVEGLIARGAEAIEFYAREGIEAAMNRYNGS